MEQSPGDQTAEIQEAAEAQKREATQTQEADPGRGTASPPQQPASPQAIVPRPGTSNQGDKEKPVSMKQMYQTCVVIAVISSLLSVFIYDRLFAVKLAVYDLPGHQLALRNALAAGEISIAEVEQSMVVAKERLDALPKNYVVLSGDIVLGNALPVTKVPVPRIPKKPAQQSGNMSLPDASALQPSSTGEVQK